MLGKLPAVTWCLSFLLMTATPFNALATLAKQRRATTHGRFPKWRIRQPATAQDANHPVLHRDHRFIKNAGRYWKIR
jgi:hypothetical protein